MPGPGKKPASLKVIAGTDRKDRDVPDALALPILGDVPEPPAWLRNAHALEEWHRLAPILVANKLLTEGGLTAFAHLCATHGNVVQMCAAGMAPNASTLSQLRNLLNDFGLTPVAQGKVKPVGEGPAENEFKNNGQRPGRKPRAA